MVEEALFLYLFTNGFQFPLKSLPSLKREFPPVRAGRKIVFHNGVQNVENLVEMCVTSPASAGAEEKSRRETAQSPGGCGKIQL